MHPGREIGPGDGPGEEPHGIDIGVPDPQPEVEDAGLVILASTPAQPNDRTPPDHLSLVHPHGGEERVRGAKTARVLDHDEASAGYDPGEEHGPRARGPHRRS